MVEPILKACVIGAGVMDAGIAAQVGTSGTPVLLLLDIVRDRRGAAALRRMP